MHPTLLHHRHLRTVLDLTPGEIEDIINRAFAFKAAKDRGRTDEQILKGKTVAMVFEKPSLRTKVAFETAITSLGGTPVFLSGGEIFKRADGSPREKIGDIAGVLERYCDAIVARVNFHDSIREMADFSSVPVINALCDLHHPTQALADLMAIRWHKPGLNSLKITFIGDGSNVATSLMQICVQTGHQFVHAGHPDHKIPTDIWKETRIISQTHGIVPSFTEDPRTAVTDSDVVYADTFVSMGDEAGTNQRQLDLAPYQVTKDLMGLAKPDAIFLHCLPAHRGEEVAAAVIDGPQSKIFDLAECRMHVAKAIFSFLFN